MLWPSIFMFGFKRGQFGRKNQTPGVFYFIFGGAIFHLEVAFFYWINIF